MFTLPSCRVVIYSLASILFLFHAFADARLVRGGGRGTYTDSATDAYYLIDNLYLNSVGIAEDFMAIQMLSKNSQDPHLLTTPSDCMRNLGSFSDYNFAIDNGFFIEEPCYYEFYENEERLTLNGFSPFAFNLAQSAQIIWTISQLGQPDLTINQNISAFDNGDILLDILMPSELIPGEYQVDLDITLYSGLDANFYYDASGEGNSFQYDCDTVNDVCGYTSFYSSDTLSFSARYAERLVILAEQQVEVAEPAILALMLLGLMGIRRQKQRFS
ncbi:MULTISPECIES: hypothetical protein [Aliiglaciecola]|uniref:hypothetical protein n=1 Tax=Aliiglaciecola TaxID=1406885 RepID=UPI001C07EFFE|nr:MULTISPECIES: hypothetical protein [Aliiglaciecola]MBU2879478.1 hypothetical protein [Aliiglaciecola lipolytica]MDO6713077.1 hypothetical protein [Aliiglaciecola sp. 2_MG-2023]MDO6754157.1 hypothetical protein [Aliiglaciecola sp. 1_MG-2023]